MTKMNVNIRVCDSFSLCFMLFYAHACTHSHSRIHVEQKNTGTFHYCLLMYFRHEYFISLLLPILPVVTSDNHAQFLLTYFSFFYVTTNGLNRSFQIAIMVFPIYSYI